MSVAMWNSHSWPLHVSGNMKLPFLTTTCQWSMWNCHSWPLHVSSNVKLPCLTIRCQYRECISECEHFIWKLGSQCELHFKLGGGVYLTAYLGTASENLNSHLILVSSSDKFWGCISKSEHFIWKFGSQCELHLKLGGVYLTAYLRTASENLNSHLILVTSSNNFWRGKLWNCHIDHQMSVAIWNCHSWPLHVGSNVKLPFLTTTCQ